MNWGGGEDGQKLSEGMAKVVTWAARIGGCFSQLSSLIHSEYYFGLREVAGVPILESSTLSHQPFPQP